MDDFVRGSAPSSPWPQMASSRLGPELPRRPLHLLPKFAAPSLPTPLPSSRRPRKTSFPNSHLRLLPPHEWPQLQALLPKLFVPSPPRGLGPSTETPWLLPSSSRSSQAPPRLPPIAPKLPLVTPWLLPSSPLSPRVAPELPPWPPQAAPELPPRPPQAAPELPPSSTTKKLKGSVSHAWRLPAPTPFTYGSSRAPPRPAPSSVHGDSQHRLPLGLGPALLLSLRPAPLGLDFPSASDLLPSASDHPRLRLSLVWPPVPCSLGRCQPRPPDPEASLHEAMQAPRPPTPGSQF